MFDITTDEVKFIENSIFPSNGVFDDDQRKVLFSNSSSNIVACPGSGKTTVLIAKIAILLKKSNVNSAKGICIITHTNVGVEEIKTRLKGLGIDSIGYPHFIGTIQEFFNHFFARKAYALLFKNKKRLTFLEEDEYTSYFIRAFEQYKPSWYKRKPPIRTMKECYIKFDDNNQAYLTNIASNNQEYINSIVNSLLYLIDRGVLRHKESLSLTEWYLNNVENQVQEALYSRFSHFLMDETQDTSVYQLELIEKIIDHRKIIFQRFGDPYQALYNLYNNEEDAWVPMDEDTLQISKSNRFGETIANVLRTTCVEEYGHLQGNKDIESFPPHLLVYTSDTQSEVIEKFANIVNKFNNENEQFRKSLKPIFAVCQHHDEINKYHDSYIRKKKEPQQSVINLSLNAIIQILVKYIRNDSNKHNYSIAMLEEYILEKDKEALVDFKAILASWVQEIVRTEGDIENLKDEIMEYFKYIIKQFFESNIDNYLLENNFNKAKNEFVKIFAKNQTEEIIPNKINELVFNDIKVNLNSIHAVKGETHKATLIMESNKKKGEHSKTKDISSVFDFLVGRFNQELTSNKEVNNALKLIYVGISRATHLVAVAVNKENLSSYDSQKQLAVSKGWKVVEVY